MAQPLENTCEQNEMHYKWMFPKIKKKSKFQG